MARRRLGPPSFISDLPPEIGAELAQPRAAEPPAVTAAEAVLPPSPAASRLGMRPPIASIAGQSAAEAALNELASDLRRARDEGRLVQDLPLEAVDEGHLVRDRIALAAEDLEALKTSLRDRGQQMPIEVVDLGQGRYGLISGWRRLTALRDLAQEAPERFGRVLALLRRPAGSAEAYRAMVEENEIRVGLSYYERARIAARAVQQGVFPDTFAALAGLFPTASRAKRSKIGSFIRIHDALDEVLRFPAALPERLGLELAKALDQPERAAVLRQRLSDEVAENAEAEQQLLKSLLTSDPARSKPKPQPKPLPESSAAGSEAAPTVQIERRQNCLTLSGPGVDAGFEAELRAWIEARSAASLR